MLKKFAVAPINHEDRTLGILDFADTREVAEAIVQRATATQQRWQHARVVDSLEQLAQFAKAARSAKLNL